MPFVLTMANRLAVESTACSQRVHQLRKRLLAKAFGVRGQCPSMSQSCNLNPFSKLLSHFSLFDSQFFAAPFAIHDCCLSCRRVALSDIFGLWQSTRVSISSRNIICALSQPMAGALR